MRVSLCLIVKDEALRLERCLRRWSTIVDEMVVVDTGSRDGTPEIARSCGALVDVHEWDGDFSAARNRSLDLASGEWIFWFDPDEELDESDARRLVATLAQTSRVGFHLPRFSYSRAGNWFLDWVTRVFRRDSGVRFAGRVHEAPSGLNAVLLQVPVHHSGWSQGGEILAKKRERYILANRELARENPGQFKPRFEIARLLFDGGDVEALPEELNVALSLSTTPLHVHMVKVLEGHEKRLRADMEGARRCFEEAIVVNPKLYWGTEYLAWVLEEMEDNEAALRAWRDALDIAQRTGVDSAHQHLNLAWALHRRGEEGSAREHVHAALARNPRLPFVPVDQDASWCGSMGFPALVRPGEEMELARATAAEEWALRDRP